MSVSFAANLIMQSQAKHPLSLGLPLCVLKPADLRPFSTSFYTLMPNNVNITSNPELFKAHIEWDAANTLIYHTVYQIRH